MLRTLQAYTHIHLTCIMLQTGRYDAGDGQLLPGRRHAPCMGPPIEGDCGVSGGCAHLCSMQLDSIMGR